MSIKNKKLYIICIICLIFLGGTVAQKTFENDTYFTIATGNYIMQNGIDEAEPFTFHENLKFQKVRWGFDVLVSGIYNLFRF